jgi:predicted RNase H-like HicB family nuclease
MIGVIEMPHTYAIEIFFSDEDEEFIAVVPELAGCSAFGETEEEALQEVEVAIDLWLDTAREEGREIPEPSGREHLREILVGKGVLREQMA